MSLWKALRVLSPHDERPEEFDFERLIRRAGDQFAIVEKERVLLGEQIFSGSERASKV